MENDGVVKICSFDRPFDMDSLSKLWSVIHALSFARTMVLSKLVFVRKNVSDRSDREKSNIEVLEAWFAFGLCFRSG